MPSPSGVHRGRSKPKRTRTGASRKQLDLSGPHLPQAKTRDSLVAHAGRQPVARRRPPGPPALAAFGEGPRRFSGGGIDDHHGSAGHFPGDAPLVELRSPRAVATLPYAEREQPSVRGEVKGHPPGGSGQIDESGYGILHGFSPRQVIILRFPNVHGRGTGAWKNTGGRNSVKEKFLYHFIFIGFKKFFLDPFEKIVYILWQREMGAANPLCPHLFAIYIQRQRADRGV